MAIPNPVKQALAAAETPKASSDRVATALKAYRSLTTDEVVDAAISEFPSGELGRVHEAVWLFSNTRISESSLIDADEDDLDFIALTSVRHVVVHSKAYDWTKATEKSRLRVEIWFSAEQYGQIKASGANCDWLRSVLNRSLLPNIRPATNP
jgi:hypothetical protein